MNTTIQLRQATPDDQQRMGFPLLEGDGKGDGFPVFADSLRPNDAKVLFRLKLTE